MLIVAFDGSSLWCSGCGKGNRFVREGKLPTTLHSGCHITFASTQKDVEYVSEENVGSFSICDVVLPLPGCSVLYPKNKSERVELLSSVSVRVKPLGSPSSSSPLSLSSWRALS